MRMKLPQGAFEYMKNKTARMRGLFYKLSIHSRIIVSFVVVILLLSSLNVTLLLSSVGYSRQYNTIVTNITAANGINGIVKTKIDTEMWNIVAGKISFEEGRQYEIIREVNSKIRQIMEHVSSPESRTKLDVTLRTMNTLTHYVDLMGEQIKRKARVAENEKVLDEIRAVSSLVEDDIQEFVLYELKSSEMVNQHIQSNINRWMFTNIAVLFLTLVFSFLAALLISSSISNPIRALNRTTASIAEGNFDVRVETGTTDEIAGLAASFNIMVVKIKQLLENSIKEQENLKKSELKALQAQINPHFLYNTLDTIVWMAEGNKSEQVIEIVRALSNFFRITLSKGKDWITVRDEVEHIRNYLIIQKIRYRDIMDFSIEVEEDILEYKILKLTLQPLVENALYHGIKNKRTGGSIWIKGHKQEEGKLLFQVTDNGMGMTGERKAEVQMELDSETTELYSKESGFGLNNVQKRIKLYYGKEYGLSISSEYTVGTRVMLSLPMER